MKPLLKHFLVSAALLAPVHHAFAQTPQSDDVLAMENVKTRAVELAKYIGEQQLFLSNRDQMPSVPPAVDPAMALRVSRIDAMRSISLNDTPETPQAVLDYVNMAELYGTRRDRAVGEFLLDFVEFKPMRGTVKNPGLARERLGFWSKSEDWFVAHMATLGKVSVNSDEENISYAMQMAVAANDALEPTDDAYVLEARANTLTIIAMLHARSGNLIAAVRATEDVIAAKRQLGLAVDGQTLLTNLVFVATSWGEHELGLDILEHVPASGDDGFFGLKEMRQIRLLTETGQYRAALDLIDGTESRVDYPPFQAAWKAYRTVALAGLGRTRAARAQLDSELFADASGSIERIGAHAEMILAAREGRVDDVVTHSNTIVRDRVRSVLDFATTDTAKFLATLDNETARRDERQAALERDAASTATKARQAIAISALLAAVAALLALLAVFAVRFARWRSENVELVEQLTVEAQSADRSKRNFLGMMSHELRTPLNGVIGLADHLGGTLGDGRKAELAGMISESGYDLLDVVENILDMSRIDTGQMVVFEEALDLRALVADVAALWRPMITSRNNGRDVRFTTFVDPGVPDVVELDPARMRQILNQLLSNAGKFTHTGRVHMHVTAERVEDGALWNIQFIIADTGMGITEEARARLFEPFVQADTSTTRKFGGSGLGLAITRSLARIMDGDIEVVSSSGRGSEFRLSIGAFEALHPGGELRSHLPSPLVAAEEALMVRRNSKPSQFWNPSAPAPRFAPPPAAAPTPTEPRDETPMQRLRRWVSVFRTVMSPADSRRPAALPPELAARAAAQADKTRDKRRRVESRPTRGPSHVPARKVEPGPLPEFLPEYVPGLGTKATSGPYIDAAAAFHTGADFHAGAAFHGRAAQMPAPTPTPAPDPAKPLRIIAAEDVVMNQQVLQALIAPDAGKVTCVGTAEALVEAHVAEPFDVIIMDIHMPGMGGIEGIESVRAFDTSVPIIALTADVGAQTHARAHHAGADLFLTKPVIAADLREALDYCTGLRRKAA